ncbi:CDP-alcohol phosphatidyltransferase family protein [Janibacter sp. GXQ6167]|uniref:CDP-alcohol phosphatidyltransferase family protein n=1 Tax=Janibacter sp. GXQ6167 TaxID=3240791 RepID=UPI0035245B21
MSSTTGTSPPARAGGLWTLPNLLSALRLLGVPLFLWALLTERDGLAVIILMASGITDYLDGWIARRFAMTSRVGAMLDPIADRLYIFTTVLGLAYREVIPWWVVAILIARDVLLSIMLLTVRDERSKGLPVHFVGKAATACLLYAFPLLLLAAGTGTLADISRPVGWAFAWWGMVLYWVSVVVYAVQVAAIRAQSGGERVH